jgi:uncharacterized membrane protein
MATKNNRIRILYAGDSWLTAATWSAGSSFSYDFRGTSVEYSAEKILEEWRRNPRYEVTYMAGWDVVSKFPETTEALGRHDVLILSDLDSDSIVLYPNDRATRVPMGPNRLKVIRDYVRRGGALLMIGGYFSFVGRQNAGNYRGTPVEEVLPVNCLAVNDDRVEAPEGVQAKALDQKHPILRGIRFGPELMFSGYNRVKAKRNAKVLAVIKETGDPLIAVGRYGKGRTMVFTSDIAPHWGAGFQTWSLAARFLDQTLEWLAAR